MAVTEQDRLALRAKLNEVLGERETDVLMDCVPPVDYEQLATRSDLETQRLLLSSQIESQGVTLTADISTLRADMDTKMATQLRITTVTHIGSMIGLAAFMTAIT